MFKQRMRDNYLQNWNSEKKIPQEQEHIHCFVVFI